VVNGAWSLVMGKTSTHLEKYFFSGAEDG